MKENVFSKKRLMSGQGCENILQLLYLVILIYYSIKFRIISILISDWMEVLASQNMETTKTVSHNDLIKII